MALTQSPGHSMQSNCSGQPQGNPRSHWADWVTGKGPGTRLAAVTVKAAEEVTAVPLGKAEGPGSPGNCGRPACLLIHEENRSLQLLHKY